MHLKVFKILALASLLLLNPRNYIFAHGDSDKNEEEWNPISAGPFTAWTASL
jgi:hypothetical protein